MSSRSSNGSEDNEALGVDLLEEGLTTDLVFRSTRPDVLEDTEDCWDCEFVARALDDRRGEGGAIEGVGEVEENEGGSMREGGGRYESSGACSTVEQMASFPTFKDQLKQGQVGRIEYDEIVVKVAGAE